MTGVFGSWKTVGASVLALLAVSGCVAPTPFQPADPAGRDGYTVTQIETYRYRLSFAGNSDTPRGAVDNDLLYLAAQVTLKGGGDWFELTQNDSDKTTSYPTYFDGGFGGGGRWGGGWGGRWGGWGGYDTDFSVPRNSYDHVAEIVIKRGQKPANAMHAYDARDVVAHLQPLIARTEARPGPF